MMSASGLGYADGHDSGTRFRDLEERGWDPENTYLVLMTVHKDDARWTAGFEHGLNGVPSQEES